MRPRSGPSLRGSALALSAALFVGACAPRDAQVGVAAQGDAGAGRDASAILFSSELATNGGLWNEYTPLPGARIDFGVPATGAADGVAELRFPGEPALMAADRSDADLNTGLESRQYFRYGTFRARVQFATCAPGEEVVSAVFMYFADGSDANKNGLSDVHELDLHVPCGTPSFIVMTGWSDYDGPDDAPTFLKHSRAVDTATGDVYDTVEPAVSAFTKTGSEPALVVPGFPAAGAFYEVGIDWQPSRVRFFIVRGGAEVTLWTLTDAAYIPQVPLPLGLNLWHPPTHWVPTRGPADYPADDAVMRVDRVEWRSP